MGRSDAKAQKPLHAGSANSGERPGEEPLDMSYIGETLLVLAFLGAAVGMLMIPIVFYASYSGAFRWVITLGLVTAAAVAAMRVIYPIGARPSKAPVAESFARDDGGRYASLREMAERASAGYAYSQKALNERMADAFLDKLRIRKGLDPGDVFRLSGSESALAAACGDAELAKFVVKSKAAISERAERRRFVTRREMRGRGDVFNAEAVNVIGRIEAWEG